MKEGTNLGSTSVKVVVKRTTTIAEDKETKMNINDGLDLKVATVVQASPTTSEVDKAVSIITNKYPTPFKLMVQLAFSMLSHVLKNPIWKALPFTQSTLNLYLTIVFTFLATLLKHPGTLAILEWSIPWDRLAKFIDTIPQNVMVS